MGPTRGTCREDGRIAARWHVSTRVDTLTFDHHRAVAGMDDNITIQLLRWCAETDPPPLRRG